MLGALSSITHPDSPRGHRATAIQTIAHNKVTAGMGAMQTIKKLSALIVLVVAGCNSFASAQEMRWIEYRPAGEGFRVEMPENPEVVSHELNSQFGPLKQIMAKVELIDRSFAVAYLDVPEDKSGRAVNDVETQLDGGRDGAVRGMTVDGNKATLRSEKRMSVSGYPAREIIVDIPALKIVSVMRLLIVKKRAFSVGFTSFAGSEGKSDVSRFLDSFVVLQSQ